MNKKGIAIIEILAVIIIVGLFTILIIGIFQDIDYGLKEGNIVDKRYTNSYITYRNTYVNGKSISIPVTQPPSWSLKISKEINGKEKSIWIEVTEKEYESYKIGDYYNK